MDWTTELNVPLAVLAGTVAVTHFWLRNFEPPAHSFAPFIVLALVPIFPAISLILYTPYSPLWAILTAYPAFYTCLGVSVTAYRLSPFHPLAQHPGPIIARVSKLWVVWKSLDGKLPKYYQKLHAQYGPVVRIGPNELSIVDKELLPDVIGTHGMPRGPTWDGRRMSPKEAYQKEYDLILTRSSARHAQLRKAWNKAFAAEPLADYREVLFKRIALLQSRLEDICREAGRNRGATVDIAEWINFFSFDLMSDLAFGGGSEMLREGDKHHFLEKIEKSAYLPSVTGLIPWSTQASVRLIPNVGTHLRDFAAFAMERAMLRSSQTLTQKDLFYHIVSNTYKDEDASPFPLIVSNAALAILAGSDTTSSVLCNVIYYLVANPECLKKLQQELDQNAPALHGGTIAGDILEQLVGLPWLNAVINETLRLQPILPTGLQRAPEKGSGGKMVGSHFVKEGTAVTVPLYVILRDPRYFNPDPEKFWPERWLQYCKNPEVTLDMGAFIPFSMGPANCVGKQLAMAELRYVIALLAARFEMKFMEGWDVSTWEENLKDRFVLAKGKLMLEIGLRKRV
ncbi:hypothetical protein D9758_007046 [Tetrapyrgos nigripes]|uniref:Cytochrome P450 n=1 Tax=Tetrapyrgos nigripes TaxID=182062 RepID=A0A8H5GDP0_9AGAR|nr:hypothetical protein D9758_007046 [Tetrapyrgos nigripes]